MQRLARGRHSNAEGEQLSPPHWQTGKPRLKSRGTRELWEREGGRSQDPAPGPCRALAPIACVSTPQPHPERKS